MIKRFFAFLLLIPVLAGAQKLKKDEKQLMDALRQHVVFLADDRLEGRRTGTEGERLAAEYISSRFRDAGLKPMTSGSYFQEFSINEGRSVDGTTRFSIDGNSLLLNRDFFPLAFSGNGRVEANPSLALEEDKMPWFMDLNETLAANAANPHYDLQGALVEKAKEVRRRGATALIVYNSGTRNDGLRFDAKDRTASAAIPIVYVGKDAARKYFSDPSASLDVVLDIQVKDVVRKGMNVVGYLDKGAASTVIIGAHYDHLGYGEDGNSRETGVKAIHNGADDNASGTSALIELSRMLAGSKIKNHNFLFIAFSGEELGLYGSKYFTENPSVSLSAVNYMINLDMVGRLNDSSRTVTVGGYGTTPSWGRLYGQTGKKGLYAEGLQFRFDSSGTGPSDHTSFYRKDIPVLFYFTGLHSDYHKPSDDHDKINYLGQMRLVKHIYSLVEATDKMNQKLAFTKTREAQTTTTARFSVSLGIMPDYTFSGEGVKADGVTAGRAAEKAGIKAGDIIVSIGEHRTSSIENYMQALSKFKKGDKVKVKYLREGKEVSTDVEF